jgi:hypothetical protein
MLRFFFEASYLTATLAVLLNKSICAVCFFCGRILLRSPYAANNLRMQTKPWTIVTSLKRTDRGPREIAAILGVKDDVEVIASALNYFHY